MKRSLDKATDKNQSLQSLNVVDRTKRSSVTPISVHQCRICLQNQQQSRKEMLAPCQCIGSVQFIHKECLQQWITKSLKREILKQPDIQEKTLTSQCEMCKYCIPYRVKLDNVVNCTTVYSRLMSNKIFSFLLFLMILSILCSLSYLIWYATSRRLNFSGQKVVESSLVYGSCLFLLLFLAMGVFFFLSDFLLAIKLTVIIIKPSQRYSQRIQASINPETVIQEID